MTFQTFRSLKVGDIVRLRAALAVPIFAVKGSGIITEALAEAGFTANKFGGCADDAVVPEEHLAPVRRLSVIPVQADRLSLVPERGKPGWQP
jgi:hypothetical protein